MNKQSTVGTEHLLLTALCRDLDFPGMKVLTELGIMPQQIRRQIYRVISQSQQDEEEESDRTLRTSPERPSSQLTVGRSTPRKREKGKQDPLVDQLATDLTALAEAGKLDLSSGVRKKSERVIQILARRAKNNPALIGEPGVGKTAIVEGLAQRIVEGDVPALLLNKRVVQLDVGSLVAGTMYRGQFGEFASSA